MQYIYLVASHCIPGRSIGYNIVQSPPLWPCPERLAHWISSSSSHFPHLFLSSAIHLSIDCTYLTLWAPPQKKAVSFSLCVSQYLARVCMCVLSACWMKKSRGGHESCQEKMDKFACMLRFQLLCWFASHIKKRKKIILLEKYFKILKERYILI